MSQPESPRTASFRWPIAERRLLEDELRHNFEFARALYEDLRNEHRRVRELATAALTHDRDLLLDRCSQLHDAVQLALDQYRDALYRFNRLVLDGKLPE